MTVYMDASADTIPGTAIGFLIEEGTPPGARFGRAGLELNPNEGEFEALAERTTGLTFGGFSTDTADYPFYPVPLLSIFALDGEKGFLAVSSGWPGPIGSVPGEEPVVYIDRETLTPYRVAESAQEFLSLALYWQGWQCILHGGEAEVRMTHNNEIAEKLRTVYDPHSPAKMRQCLMGRVPTLYPSFEAARRQLHIVTPREVEAGTAVWPWEDPACV